MELNKMQGLTYLQIEDKVKRLYLKPGLDTEKLLRAMGDLYSQISMLKVEYEAMSKVLNQHHEDWQAEQTAKRDRQMQSALKIAAMYNEEARNA